MYRLIQDFLCTQNFKKRKSKIQCFKSGSIAYMCPHCFNIIMAHGSRKLDYEFDTDDVWVSSYVGYTCKKCKNEIYQAIELDPNIASMISKLNKKGYTTAFCCEGHTSKNYNNEDAYIMFRALKMDPNNIPKYWYVDYEYDNGFTIRCDNTKYSKTKYLKSLDEWVDSLPDYECTKYINI